MLKNNQAILALLTLCLIDKAYADSDDSNEITALNNRVVTFDSTSLFGNSKKVDLTRFQSKNYVEPGHYLVNTYVNGQDIGDMNVQFDHFDDSSSAVLCVDRELLNQLNLTTEILENLPNKSCLLIKDIASEAYYIFNQSELKLDIYIPQRYVIDLPKGYIDPERFSDGVTSAFVGYDFNYNKDDINENKYLSLSGGLNTFGWFFRHRGNFSSTDSGLGSYESTYNTLYKDISKINSRLSLGQFTTQNYNLDSIPILGAQLSSDLEMLPASLRSSAPVLENIAYTNALIKVYQNGQKIYEKNVPAGPFTIPDLTTYSDGDIILEINETGGEQRIFTIPFQNTVSLLKKGLVNYSTSMGQYFYQQHQSDDYVFQGNMNYGLSNYMTGTLGLNITNNFYSILLGSAFNTSFGGFNVFAEQQKSTFENNKLKGLRTSVNYMYTWAEKKTSFSSDFTHYEKDYISLSNHLYLKNNNNNSQLNNNLNFDYSYNLKNNYGFYLSKSFDNANLGSLRVGYRNNSYWKDEESFDQYILTYSNRYKRINYNLSVTQNAYSNQNRKNDVNAYLSVNIPLQWKEKKGYLNSYIQHSGQNNQTAINNRISGNLGRNNEVNFGVGIQNDLNHRSNNQDTLNGYFNYRLPQFTLASTANYSDNSTQYSLSANGAVVAHPYGISLVNYTPTTYTIIHAKDAKGAQVTNAWGVEIDRFGNAIYPNNTAYQVNTISLDPSNLPTNVNFVSNQKQVIPKRYSAQLAVFETQKSSNILLNVKSITETSLPIGSQLYNSNHQVIGTLGPTQQIMLESEEGINHPMLLAWGEGEENSCTIFPLNTKALYPNKELQMISVECK